MAAFVVFPYLKFAGDGAVPQGKEKMRRIS
jgi:hypothetical protein